MTSIDQQPGRQPGPQRPPEGMPVRLLDRAESLRLLATARIGRLVFTYQAMPDVLPVNVALGQDVLLIPFADGSMIERAARNTVVALHADKIDEATQVGWSVTVVGRSFELGEGDARVASWGLQPRPGLTGGHDRTLAVALERVTGRSIGPGVK